MLKFKVSILATAIIVILSACGRETTDKQYEDFDPGNFTNPTVIDNEWFPIAPGMNWIYEGTTIEEGVSVPHRLEFSVTDLVKEIGGVDTLVAWIVDYKDHQPVEIEISFFAQDDDGRVWYLGEHPEEYENGEFIDAPTWIHGIHDAVAGIKMPAQPQLETPSYSQGWGPEVDFQDRGQVSQVGLETCVPVDCYNDVMIISEFTKVEPDAFQLKYYARDVGNVRVGWEGQDAQKEDLQLVEFRILSAEELAQVRNLALELEKHAYEISPEVYALTSQMR